MRSVAWGSDAVMPTSCFHRAGAEALMDSIIISAAVTADYPALLDLNDSAVPNVNSIPLATLEHLHRQSAYLGVARRGGERLGFLLALPESADYDSINFGYFRRNYPRFIYIDRIVVGANARRSGIGAALYADLQRAIAGGWPLLTCEVNVRPDNPRSLSFHEQLGFESVGEQDTEGGSKRVRLMALAVGSAAGEVAAC
jgi:uncharacterized protein